MDDKTNQQSVVNKTNQILLQFFQSSFLWNQFTCSNNHKDNMKFQNRRDRPNWISIIIIYRVLIDERVSFNRYVYVT